MHDCICLVCTRSLLSKWSCEETAPGYIIHSHYRWCYCADECVCGFHAPAGEDVYISLYGAATDVNLRLERNSVLLEKTYISMANQRSVAIVNRSDTIVHYQWKSCATEEEEKHQKQRWDMPLGGIFTIASLEDLSDIVKNTVCRIQQNTVMGTTDDLSYSLLTQLWIQWV